MVSGFKNIIVSPEEFLAPILLAPAKPRFNLFSIRRACGYLDFTRVELPSEELLSTTMTSLLKASLELNMEARHLSIKSAVL